MLISVPDGYAFNAYEPVVLPSPKDYFGRYGFRNGRGVYTASVDNISEPCVTESSTVIDELVSTERRFAGLLENPAPVDTEKNSR